MHVITTQDEIRQDMIDRALERIAFDGYETDAVIETTVDRLQPELQTRNPETTFPLMESTQ